MSVQWLSMRNLASYCASGVSGTCSLEVQWMCVSFRRRLDRRVVISKCQERRGVCAEKRMLEIDIVL